MIEISVDRSGDKRSHAQPAQTILEAGSAGCRMTITYACGMPMRMNGKHKFAARSSRIFWRASDFWLAGTGFASSVSPPTRPPLPGLRGGRQQHPRYVIGTSPLNTTNTRAMSSTATYDENSAALYRQVRQTVKTENPQHQKHRQSSALDLFPQTAVGQQRPKSAVRDQRRDRGRTHFDMRLLPLARAGYLARYTHTLASWWPRAMFPPAPPPLPVPRCPARTTAIS